jgi:enolase
VFYLDFKIKKIKAREILDSRGNPTIEVEVSTKNQYASAIVPSGISTGRHEALELRDGGKRYNGKGVLKAVRNVNKLLALRLKGFDCRDQKEIDEFMNKLDGTSDKSNLGANTILGVSLAVSRLAARLENKPLYRYLGKSNIIPIPFMNIINGGSHAQNRLSFQEFMIVPFEKNFKESLRIATEAYHELKTIIIKRFGKVFANVGDEGGFAPNLNKVEEPIRLILKTTEKLGYNKKIKLALDVAASEFYNKKKEYYLIDNKKFGCLKLIDLYEQLIKNYPIISIEDPFYQDNFYEFRMFTEEFGNKIQIVGDDLLVTNKTRIKTAVKLRACNALLLKLNQIGTLSEAVDSALYTMNNEWNVMVSHRSGETEDTFIADLTVALGCGQIKSGAPCRSERLAKYNQLLRIEEELGKYARYAGRYLKIF